MHKIDFGRETWNYNNEDALKKFYFGKQHKLMNESLNTNVWSTSFLLFFFPMQKFNYYQFNYIKGL